MKVLIATAIYPTKENPAFGSFVRTQAESLERAGVSADVLVLKGRFRKAIYPRGVIQLRDKLKRGDIDLVHAHYSYVGLVARTQWQVPVVVTYHGDDLLGTINEQGRPTRLSPAIVALGRWLARHVDAVIVQSREMAAKLDSARVFIIPHEVDFAIFSPANREEARQMLGLENSKKYLLFAANPKIPVKRFPLARSVAELLAEKDPSVELLVVYRETQERLALYLSACDVLVFPSYQEGSPNVVKQAMACNLPIVATDVGDVREVLGKTERCFLCEPDPGRFAEKVGMILSSGERTIGRECIRHLDSGIVARKLIDVYEQVLGERQRLPPRHSQNQLVAREK